MSLTTKILQAAMASDKHVFVNYMPHTNGLSVYAHPVDTDYQDTRSERPRLMDETVYLDWEGAEEKMADVLAQIEELNHA